MLKIDNITASFNKSLKEKLTPNNACIFYNIFKLNYNKQSQIYCLNYIERWFCTIVKSSKHVELGFNLVKDIFLSPQLKITSEIEVFNAAHDWLEHDFFERSKFAVDLVKMIRLSLLPPSTSKKLLRASSFSVCAECKKYTDTLLSSSTKKQFGQTPTCFQNRYCSQENFNLVVCGWLKDDAKSNLLYTLNGKKLSKATNVMKMMERKLFCSNVVIDENVYCLSENSLSSYSMFTKKWKCLGKFTSEKRVDYCVCPFMSKIYVFGGVRRKNISRTCIVYDPKTCKWRQIASLIEPKTHAACSVFAGKIVVAGGEDWFFDFMHNKRLRNGTRTVQVYDHFSNKWSRMPDMLSARAHHASVSVANKLYMVGGNTRRCEVFDYFTNKFVNIEDKLPIYNPIDLLQQNVTIGNKIWLLNGRTLQAVIFDIENEKWSVMENFGEKNHFGFSYSKIPD